MVSMLSRQSKPKAKDVARQRSVPKDKKPRPRGIEKDRTHPSNRAGQRFSHIEEQSILQVDDTVPKSSTSFGRQRIRELYTPIQAANDIRLFLLCPGSQDSPVEGKLVHATLDESLGFEALSYKWGDAAPTKTIIVNGSSVEVGENLWSALWHIREYDKLHDAVAGRTLWVDALCINQNDMSERTQQVKLMSKIYGTAEVVVWLGPESDESDLAFKVLDTIDVGNYMLDTTEREFAAFVRLLNRDYFHRMWVIQEISIPWDVMMHCGLCKANFRAAQWFTEYFAADVWGDEIESPCTQEGDDQQPSPAHRALLSRVRDQVAQSLAAQFFRSPYLRFGGQQNSSLLDLLSEFQYSKCSDPRDKVFALLSLAKDCKHGEVVADYHKSVLDVYWDVMSFAYNHVYGPEDPASYSRMLQRSLQVPRDSGEGFEKDAVSKLKLDSHRRPWISFGGWGGGAVIECGTTFSKPYLRNLREKHKLTTVVKADMEDIVSIRGLPKAIFAHDKRSDRAFLESKGKLPLDFQYLDVSEATTRGKDYTIDTSSLRGFILDTGLIGLGPMQIRQSDLVRRIMRNGSLAVVLRRDSFGLLTIIGTAIVLCTRIPRGRSWNWPELISSPRDDFFGEGLCGFSIPKVTFFLDRVTLQQWTRWNGEL